MNRRASSYAWTLAGCVYLAGSRLGILDSGLPQQRVANRRRAGERVGGRLSRDGKWLAYYLLESGTFEVYATPYPEGGLRWVIAEGTDPSWGPDAGEIYYRSGPRLLAARVDKTAGVKVTATRVVLHPFLPPLYDDYDIHPDGRTLVTVRPVNRTQGREVTVVVGLFSGLSREVR